jgi:hypothetical protein
LPDVLPAFIHRIGANARTATTAATTGRRTRAPRAWNASDPVYSFIEFDATELNTMAIRASTPMKPPPISVRTPAAVWLPSTLAPASPMPSTQT